MSTRNPISFTVTENGGQTLVESTNYVGTVPRKGEYIYLENEKRIRIPYVVGHVVWSFNPKNFNQPDAVVVAVDKVHK